MTTIEWTDKAWNPISGCTPISEGCANCYAKRIAKRLAGRFGYPDTPNEFAVTEHRDKLWRPLRWLKPCNIFVASMGDLFHKRVSGHYISEIFGTMSAAHWHTFQILTKRPDRMLEFQDWWFESRRSSYLRNMWLGVSVENANQLWRVHRLLQTPAAFRFVSLEPLLGPINLRQPCGPNTGDLMIDRLDWVIVGGETGPGARAMHPAWVRDIRDQCQKANTPFFFKQWGAWAPSEALDPGWQDRALLLGTLLRTVISRYGLLGINDKLMYCVGKKRAGRVLGYRKWSQMPDRAPQERLSGLDLTLKNSF